MKSQPIDYLKFWRVIRYYVKIKHKLGQADLDVILFLYSEGYFGKEKFQEFSELVSWSRSRFDGLLKRNWIQKFRRRGKDGRALYELSPKAVNLVRDIYRKLNGEEIPVSITNNPLIGKNVSYTDKVYRNMIFQMNAYYQSKKGQKYIED